MEALRDKKISAHVEKNFFEPAGLIDTWKSSLKLFYQMDHDWLAAVRNAHAFHYMRPDQFDPYLNDEHCDYAHALVGKKYGDTFFTWADIRAGHAMLDQVDSNDPFAGLGRMLDELGALLGGLCDCLAQSLQKYAKDQLTEGDALGGPRRVPAPDFESFTLPYFFWAPRKATKT